MESEKVKAIKEKLQEEIFIATKFDDKLRRVETKDLQDILTLINELESENERLLEQRNKTYNIWVKDTEKLKDRIAELECSLSKKTMEYELLKCGKKIGDGIVEVIDEAKKSLATYEALKQFAERLKEKALSHCRTINCYELKFIEETIDETLKEFIND